ncbi:Transcriptional regulator, contains XRE-family HTH domain [Tranquillimonas rosea]|uniref:Transcriptional regulator, contains XRE-family HTH domain n=1 Tax=Tranquillimonas rosea TaxID=641238 RepID=A0A1H9R9D4_9RHOB|nr:helix-turn-helix transcriptional regulator [Tranquillimonas rosea]SER69511.1 Transcriptional regulator, contains XRE-family HTH domain [Tranquillimonas rosea]
MVHPVDAHVGRQLKTARHLRELSQGDVARNLGVSFQQVQKYESGTNRVSASRLFELAVMLHVPPGYFFDGLSGLDSPDEDERLTPEDAQIARALSRITDRKTKSMLHALISEIAGYEDDRSSDVAANC